MSMELAIVRQNGDILCRGCVLADTPFSRFRGLMGRKHLGKDEGMLLATWSIHTSFMRFPIDVVFLDRSFSVLRIVSSLKPWRVAVEWSSHAVLELPAGTTARAGLEAGEELSFVAHPSGLGNPASHASPAARVAIASSDSRFLRVSGFLLERHGFEVETFRQAKDVIPKAAEGRFAAVIVDGSGSLAAAARVIRGLSVESPSTGVVVVGDATEQNGSQTSPQNGLRVVPKWESFDQLVHEIQLASSERRGYELA
jgi:uncharacterized membrane protein (UPF0127 family)